MKNAANEKGEEEREYFSIRVDINPRQKYFFSSLSTSLHIHGRNTSQPEGKTIRSQFFTYRNETKNIDL